MIEAENYEVKRFLIPGWSIRGKKYLSSEEEKMLLNKPKLYLEEKVDGKFTALKFPYNREMIIFAEDMKTTRSIFYKDLPSRLLVFDIYHPGYGFFEPWKKFKTCIFLGLMPVPLIYCGRINDKEVLKYIAISHSSAFETEVNPKMKRALSHFEKIDREKLERKNFIEGIVVKSYEKEKEETKLYAGKVVDPFFEKVMDTAGRYEEYAHENVIKPWDEEKYMNYFQKCSRKLGREIPEKILEEGYKTYTSNFDYWKEIDEI